MSYTLGVESFPPSQTVMTQVVAGTEGRENSSGFIGEASLGKLMKLGRD